MLKNWVAPAVSRKKMPCRKRKAPRSEGSTGWIKPGPHKKYPNPIYLPGNGPVERIDFAIANCQKPVHFTKVPKGLKPDKFRTAKLDPYILRRLRWALSRGSVGSYHNERLQAASIKPLKTRMRKILTNDRIPFESEYSCYCSGTVRYDEHLALICDDCLTFHGYRVATDNFMNSGGEDEESGDDDSWKVSEFEGPDTDQVTKMKFDRTNYRRTARLMKGLKEEREKKQDEENHEIEYIPHDMRTHKSEFLDYRISLLLKNNDGMEQADIREKFEREYGEVLTSSAIKTAVNRMESKGRIETDFIFDGRGKRKIVRLVAKT